MIVVKLMGGLGNQMFQYALGRRLAEAQGSEVRLDLGWYDGHPNRTYDLGAFNIRARIATPEDVAALTARPQGIVARATGRLRRRRRKRPASHVLEQEYGYDPSILGLADDVYLEGYWQSERYFEPIAGQLREELVLREPLGDESRVLAREIGDATVSVSVHVRRGDYAHDPTINEVHGTLDAAYYARCLERLQGAVGTARAFVFSDEPEWAAQNLDLPVEATFVQRAADAPAHEDLILISRCAHHVIANSSFSWWGAWLCDAPDKRVFAPRQWFRDERFETTDRLPAGWVRL